MRSGNMIKFNINYPCDLKNSKKRRIRKKGILKLIRKNAKRNEPISQVWIDDLNWTMRILKGETK